MKLKLKSKLGLTPHQAVTLGVISGTAFYGPNDTTNSVKALKENRVLSIMLQSHQVHPTVLQ